MSADPREQERDIVERLIRTIYEHGYARGATHEDADIWSPDAESLKYVQSNPSSVERLRALSRPTDGHHIKFGVAPDTIADLLAITHHDDKVTMSVGQFRCAVGLEPNGSKRPTDGGEREALYAGESAYQDMDAVDAMLERGPIVVTVYNEDGDVGVFPSGAVEPTGRGLTIIDALVDAGLFLWLRAPEPPVEGEQP